MSINPQLCSDFNSQRAYDIESMGQRIRMGEKVNSDFIDDYIDRILEKASGQNPYDTKLQMNWLITLQNNLLEGAFNQRVSESQKAYLLQSLYQLFFVLKPLNSLECSFYCFRLMASKWMTLRHYLV